MKTVVPFMSPYWQHSPQQKILWTVLAIVAAVCAMTVSAKFKVPYYPVPMTLQTFVLLLLPFIMGGTAAFAAVFSYLALGALGAPVFAAGGGIAYFTGHTGGFLLGFLAAILFLNFWLRRGMANSFIAIMCFMLAADLLIFICGIAQLAIIVGGLDKALTLGFYPFILGDIQKAVLAAALVSLAAKLQSGGSGK